MLTGDPCPGIPGDGRVIALSFQARVHGRHTDDLVCTVGMTYGERRHVLMQMKRNLSVASSAFEEVIGNAWLDFQSTNTFRRDTDRIVVAHDITSVNAMEGPRDICTIARSSIEATAWVSKITHAGASNKSKRSAYQRVQDVVNRVNGIPVLEEEVWQFLRHIEFLSHNLDRDDTEVAVALQVQLKHALNHPGRHYYPPHAAWTRLVNACVELNGVGGEVDLNNVENFIGGDLTFRFDAFRTIHQAGLPSPAGTFEPSKASETQLALDAASSVKSSSPGLVASIDSLPPARDSSANKAFSNILDLVGKHIKDGQFATAQSVLEELGKEFEALDAHQQARWYLMRGNAVWNGGGSTALAADDFLKAADLVNDEDRVAAARVRGYLLKDEVDKALEAGREATARFKDSLQVWVAYANARIYAGEQLGSEDIPKEHLDKAVAYQVVALSADRRGDTREALRLALTALEKDEVSFFVREAALRYALSVASENPVLPVLRVVRQEMRRDLERVIAVFEPRNERLWNVQAVEVISIVVTHLAFAQILLGRPQQALNLLDEATTRLSQASETWIRPRLEALRDLGRSQEALTFGREHLGEMKPESLVTFAQTAANESDLPSLVAADEVLSATHLEDTEIHRARVVLRAFRWDLEIREGRHDQVRAEAIANECIGSSDLPLLLVAARAFLQSNDATGADAYLARAATVADTTNESAHLYMVANALMNAHRFADAAPRFARIVPSDALSELHTDLLYCYLQLGELARARDVIASLPNHWASDKPTRQLGFMLAQRAGDWKLFEELVGPQLEHEPEQAKSWLLKALVIQKTHSETLEALAQTIPEVLQGSIRDLAQIAALEIQHGQAAQGLRRMYVMRRQNLASTEAAAAHFSTIVLAPPDTEGLREALPTVEAGTSIELENATGARHWRTIDPAGMTHLPFTEEFCSATSLEGRALLGLRVGDLVDGTSLHVVTITSAQRRLIALSDEALRTSPTPSSIARPVTLFTDADGDVDFTPMVEELESASRRGKELLDTYGKVGVTLGKLAELIGRDVIDLVRGWPSDGPELAVDGGTPLERERAVTVLSDGHAIVADLSALVELALVEHLPVLAAFPTVYVASLTRDSVERKLIENRTIRSSGVAFTRDGKLGYEEITEETRAQEVRFLSSILDAIDEYCSVVPSYGPLDLPRIAQDLESVLSSEDNAVLRVALQQQASVLTLDGRLRGMLGLVDVASVWPQIVLMWQRGRTIDSLSYSLAVLKMFFWHRNFVTLDATDLLAMTRQGDRWLAVGVPRLRAHFSQATVEFGSAARVTVEYVSRLFAEAHCQLGAIFELFSYLLEGLLRHPNCPPAFAEGVVARLAVYWGTKDDAIRRLSSFKAFAAQALVRSRRPIEPLSLVTHVYFCSNPPLVRSGTVKQLRQLVGEHHIDNAETVDQELPSDEHLHRVAGDTSTDGVVDTDVD